MEKILFSWSGGKDSTLALYELQQTGQYEIAALLTTVTLDLDRISMHGVRRSLLEQQAQALDIPLHQIWISKNSSNSDYEARLSEAFDIYKREGVDTVAFGDLFLEEIREYRDAFLSRCEMKTLYPIWERNTKEFLKEFMARGFKAIITCADSRKLDASFAGKFIDESFLNSLPDDVDPCGENGEFHTFVFAGPNFKREINFRIGETTMREGFYYCDLITTD